MKRILLLCGIALLLAATAARAQEAKPSEADLAAIKATALDYAESCYEGKPERMERALHPELAKRIVRTDAQTGRSLIDPMSASELVNLIARGGCKNTPLDQQQKDVTILDVFGSAATVKLVMQGWVDYMHIAKFNGRWVIINVLWETKPQPPKQ
jgi:hypothetical protein